MAVCTPLNIFLIIYRQKRLKQNRTLFYKIFWVFHFGIQLFGGLHRGDANIYRYHLSKIYHLEVWRIISENFIKIG